MDVNFNVSARMAILIGRESIPSSNGAIGEIVKNSYDADAREVIVIIDMPFSECPQEIEVDHLDRLISEYKCEYLSDNSVAEVVINAYKQNNGHYVLDLVDNNAKRDHIFSSFFNFFNRIIFIDNGCGMDEITVKNNWMTIGTSNKLNNSKSKLGRLRVGSKGIGRFSLDKLGEFCIMNSAQIDEHLIEWKIDWNAFELENAKITDVKAELLKFENKTFFSRVSSIYSKYIPTVKVETDNAETDNAELERFKIETFELENFDSGTALEIRFPREFWSISKLEKIKKDLLSLIPTNIFNPFKIYLISEQYPEINEEIKRPKLSDFDYRTIFEITSKQIRIKIFRNEFNYQLMNDQLKSILMERIKKEYTKYDASKLTLEECEFTIDTEDIIISNLDMNIIMNIGNFKFEFDYFKYTSSREDTKRFYYKTFDSRNRKEFLDENSGIKLYRDGFRVRPYGEKESFSYDWLGLGIKVASNPASITHKGGNWNVRPNQVFGRVDISRETNPRLADNASRQGLDFTNEFEAFVSLLEYLISLFEKDRVIIATTILSYNSEEIQKSDNQKQVKVAIEKAKNNRPLNEDENKKILESYIQQEEEIKALNYELNVLKSYSTSSMFTRVFKHEINHINNNFTVRLKHMPLILKKYLDINQFDKIEDRLNPFRTIESMREDTIVLNSYVKIMTSNTIKDKRKRVNHNIKDYFEKFESDWKPILKSRDIELNIYSDPFKFRCFDFDLFSIVTNLIINSAEAFLDTSFDRTRKIDLAIRRNERSFTLYYSDYGPGLDKRIKNPYDIFEESYSTKDDGTGLGMWIIQTLVNEYRGQIILDDVVNGFNLRIIFPEGAQNI